MSDELFSPQTRTGQDNSYFHSGLTEFLDSNVILGMNLDKQGRYGWLLSTYILLATWQKKRSKVGGQSFPYRVLLALQCHKCCHFHYCIIKYYEVVVLKLFHRQGPPNSLTSLWTPIDTPGTTVVLNHFNFKDLKFDMRGQTPLFKGHFCLWDLIYTAKSINSTLRVYKSLHFSYNKSFSWGPPGTPSRTPGDPQTQTLRTNIP